ARALPVLRVGEEQIGFLRLLDAEAVGEQAVEPDLPIRDEARALRLADAREGQRGVERQLTVYHVLADIEGRRVALADEGHAAPGGRAPHRGHARVRI